MANVSYLRTPIGARSPGAASGTGSTRRRLPRGRYAIGGVILLVVVVLAALAVVFSGAKASLTADSQGLAKIQLPFGGGSVKSVYVAGGPNNVSIPVSVTGDPVITPRTLVPANERVTIHVVVKRPGWISWLAGSTQHLSLTMTTPTASLRSHYITVAQGAPLKLHFKSPIEAFASGRPGHLVRHVLAKRTSEVTVPHSGDAGTVYVSAAPRNWESSRQAMVSWFPAGAKTSAVSVPAAGTQIKPTTPIELSFSKPLADALGSHRPAISPATPGHWKTISSHSIEFVPSGAGYGLGAKVSLGLPNDVRLVRGQQSSDADQASWTVPNGSIGRLQQLLSLLGYLPLNFHYDGGAGVPLSVAAQENAAVNPPKGHYSWRYGNTPSALHGFWQPGAYGTMTEGALMMFLDDHDMYTEGAPLTPAVWTALISAVIQKKRNTSGYTFVQVSKESQSLDLWHDGQTVLTTPVNTGVAADPTASGLYPVFEHLTSTTMQGTNADGSTYDDPGIPWVSYFDGGEALHGFIRASYGTPQSDGCVEMPITTAARVFPYTPVGTLVNVT